MYVRCLLTKLLFCSQPDAYATIELNRRIKESEKNGSTAPILGRSISSTATIVGQMLHAAGVNAVNDQIKEAKARRQKSIKMSRVETSQWGLAARGLGRVVGDGNHDEWVREQRRILGNPTTRVRLANGEVFDTRTLGKMADHRHHNNRLSNAPGSLPTRASGFLPTRAWVTKTPPTSELDKAFGHIIKEPESRPLTKPSSSSAENSASVAQAASPGGESSSERGGVLKKGGGIPLPRKKRSSTRPSLHPDGVPAHDGGDADEVVFEHDVVNLISPVPRRSNTPSLLEERAELMETAEQLYNDVIQLSLQKNGVIDVVDLVDGGVSSLPSDPASGIRFSYMTERPESAKEVIFQVLQARPGTNAEGMCKALDRAIPMNFKRD